MFIAVLTCAKESSLPNKIRVVVSEVSGYWEK